jgi:hypothetical protein
MHSYLLGNKFLPRTQELRLQGIIESTPRFAPWGVKAWRAPKGYSWTVLDSTPVPEAVLARDSDHKAVLVAHRYSFPVFVDDESIVLARANDSVPSLYITTRKELDSITEIIEVTSHNGHCYFPSINRQEILNAVPNLPSLIAGHYHLEGVQYVWSWRSNTGEFNHKPLSWFQDSHPVSGRESVELVRTDPATGLIIGAGAGIPSFVMTPDFNRLIGFIRKYRDGKVDESSVELMGKWGERMMKQYAESYAYVG